MEGIGIEVIQDRAWEELIRDSTKLEVIGMLLAEDPYISRKTLAKICGYKPAEESEKDA